METAIRIPSTEDGSRQCLPVVCVEGEWGAVFNAGVGFGVSRPAMRGRIVLGFAKFPQLRFLYYWPVLYRRIYRNYRGVAETYTNEILKHQRGTKSNVQGHLN